MIYFGIQIDNYRAMSTDLKFALQEVKSNDANLVTFENEHDCRAWVKGVNNPSERGLEFPGEWLIEHECKWRKLGQIITREKGKSFTNRGFVVDYATRPVGDNGKKVMFGIGYGGPKDFFTTGPFEAVDVQNLRKFVMLQIIEKFLVLNKGNERIMFLVNEPEIVNKLKANVSGENFSKKGKKF